MNLSKKKILSHWAILNVFKIIGRLITDEKQQTKNLI